MDSDICRRLLGYAMRTSTFKYRPLQGTTPVFFNRNVPEHEQRFFAIVKDLKSGEVKKYQLTMNNQGKAQKQFRDLTAGSDKIGSLGKAERNSPRWIQHKTKDGYKDVELALGEFAQKKLNMFKNNDVTIENAELMSRDFMNKAKAEYLKGYTEHTKRSQKQANDLLKESRADKKLANRYVKPVYFTLFSIRDGAMWENKARTYHTIFQSNLRAGSQKQLMESAAKYMLSYANREARETGRAVQNRLFGDGRAMTRLGEFEHIVMMGQGNEPKILFATEDISKSTKSQILLGYAYANLDPQNAKRKWWRDNRAKLEKFHTFKYLKKPVESDGEVKTFSVYEGREDGKFTVNPCKGTEKSAAAGPARVATQNCLKEFNKDTNPARSDKNVRGFFISNGAFIFSKYEENTEMDNLNKAELPAYGALGRWLLKTIPDELKSTGGDVGGGSAAQKSLVQHVTPMTIPEQLAPTEGLFVNPSAKFIYSAFTQQGDKKDVVVTKKSSHSLGMLEYDLNSQDFWLNLDTEENYNKKDRRQTTGLVFVENGAKLYPVATNK